jgi:sulfate/thiosulfate transport system ATP-binding protein
VVKSSGAGIVSIILKNINKTFDRVQVLDNINIEFKEGELTALLGPSGSGKTTLLRLVAGLEMPDENAGAQILFHHIDVAQQAVGQRQVGFVFQHYALFRHLSVFENVAFGMRVKKCPERLSNAAIADRVHELLRLVQLDNMAQRFPSQLSGGQRQRVALARALAIQPKVLLLDEPFGALDAKVRTELRNWLRELHHQLQFTSIFVTHDQEEALEVSDRIVLMNQGRIEQVGTPDDVFHQPATEFVMQFLGEVNFFHGRQFDTALETEQKYFVRPYDFEIIFTKTDQALPVTIHRILTANSVVKIDVLDEHRQRIILHLSHKEFSEYALTIGQSVFIRPRRQLQVVNESR